VFWQGERYLSAMLGDIRPVPVLTEACGHVDFGTPEAVAAAGAQLIP
jgi:hypothetical protein